MTKSPAPCTDKQLAYLRKLVEERGEKLETFLVDNGISRTTGFPQPRQVAERPSRIMASTMIAHLLDERKGRHE